MNTDQRSLKHLLIYRLALELEDKTFALAKVVMQLNEDDFWNYGNDLYRASAAVAGHIAQAHRLYSYQHKIDELAAARQEAQAVMRLLRHVEPAETVEFLSEGYKGLMKQAGALEWWLQGRLQGFNDEWLRTRPK